MALITHTALTSDGAYNGTSYTTASIAPAANRVLFLAVSSTRQGTAQLPTITGLGLTWTLVRTLADGNDRISVFWAQTSAGAPAPGSITIGYGAVVHNGCMWSVSEFNTSNLTSPIVQSADDSDTAAKTLVITLSAFTHADNATYGAFLINNDQTVTVGSGFTGIHQVQIGLSLQDRTLRTEWKNSNDTTVDETTSTARTHWGIAVEISATAIAAPATAVVTGTVTSSIIEDDIVAGGETIIITVTNDTWVTAGAAFNAIRQDIIDGLDSGGSETTGWNAEVRDNLAVTTVVRTSSTVVTITLSAQAAYNITSPETITVTVPASALTLANVVTATPTFSIGTGTIVEPPPPGGGGGGVGGIPGGPGPLGTGVSTRGSADRLWMRRKEDVLNLARARVRPRNVGH